MEEGKWNKQKQKKSKTLDLLQLEKKTTQKS